MKEKVDGIIASASYVSISTDSWTDINNKAIMNFVIHTPRPLLYCFKDVSNESETGELVSKYLLEIIEEVGPSKVTAIVTDNASVMKKSWRIVKEKYSWIQVCIII